MGLPTRDGMLAPNRARSRTARTETPGPLGQTHQIAIVRLVVLWACLVTASEASVVRLDSLGHTIARVDRSGGASSFELRAFDQEPNRRTDGRTEKQAQTQTQAGRQKTARPQGCCSCFALILVVSPSLRKWKQRKEPCSPRDLGEDCLGIEGVALARLPVLWPGSRQICLCPNAQFT